MFLAENRYAAAGHVICFARRNDLCSFLATLSTRTLHADQYLLLFKYCCDAINHVNTRKIDLKLLLSLDALLAERSVTRAARRLHLSQPALSAQLTRLRQQFRDPLFLPTSRGMLPTALALELQMPLRAVLDQMRKLVENAESFDPLTATNTFTLSASDYVQIAVLLPFMIKIKTTAPNIRFMIRLGDSRAAEQELESGDVDIAFIQPENVAKSLRWSEVFQETYVGIVSKGVLRGRKMTLQRFIRANHVIVSPRAEGFRGPTDTALATIGHSRRVNLAVSSFVFLIEAVAGSDLVAVAPRRLVERLRHRVDSFAIPVPVEGFGIAMVWHDRSHQHSGHTWLREQLALYCASKS